MTFPLLFDAFEFCTDGLKAKMSPQRDADMDHDLPTTKAAAEGAAVAAAAGGAAAKEEDAAAAAAPALPAAMESDDGDAALQAALAMSMEVEGGGGGAAVASSDETPSSALPIPGFRGQYELFAIVTHKGRSANGGHYIGWVRKSKFADKWYKFDDDVVDLIDEAEVKALKGGGDRDIAYLSFYRYVEGPMK